AMTADRDSFVRFTFIWVTPRWLLVTINQPTIRILVASSNLVNTYFLIVQRRPISLTYRHEKLLKIKAFLTNCRAARTAGRGAGCTSAGGPGRRPRDRRWRTRRAKRAAHRACPAAARPAPR